MVLHGRIMPASNATFVGEVGGERVVYKPVAGERPLWDFPDGTLAGREVAAYPCPRHSGGTSSAARSCGRARTGRDGAGVAEPTRARRGRPGAPGGCPTGMARLRRRRPARPTGSPWSTRTPRRCGGWRCSTSWSTTPTARAGTCWRCPAAPLRRRPRCHLPRRAQAAHRPVGVGGRAAHRAEEIAGVEKACWTRCAATCGRAARGPRLAATGRGEPAGQRRRAARTLAAFPDPHGEWPHPSAPF